VTRADVEVRCAAHAAPMGGVAFSRVNPREVAISCEIPLEVADLCTNSVDFVPKLPPRRARRTRLPPRRWERTIVPPRGPRDVGSSSVTWRLPKLVANSAVRWSRNPHLTAATSSQSGNRLRIASGGCTGYDVVGIDPHEVAIWCIHSVPPRRDDRSRPPDGDEFAQTTTQKARQGLNRASGLTIGCTHAQNCHLAARARPGALRPTSPGRTVRASPRRTLRSSPRPPPSPNPPGLAPRPSPTLRC
jgi:hypothetical protein